MNKKISVVSYYNDNNFAPGIIASRRWRGLQKYCDGYDIVWTYSNDNTNPKNGQKISQNIWDSTQSMSASIKDGLVPNDAEIILNHIAPFETALYSLTQKLLYDKTWIVFLNEIPVHISPLYYERTQQLFWYNEIETKYILKFADKVIFSDIQQKNWVLKYAQFPDCDRFVVVSNSYEKRKTTKKEKTEKVIFRYMGGFYYKRDLMEFLNAFGKLTATEEYNNVYLEIYSHNYDVIYNNIKHFKNIKCKNQVSSKKSLELIDSADFLVASDADLKDRYDYYPFVTSKLFEYMGSNTPIVYVGMEDSPNTDIIKNIGGYFSNFDETNIQNMIKKAIKEKEGFIFKKEIEQYSLENISKVLDIEISNTKKRNLFEECLDDMELEYFWKFIKSESIQAFSNKQQFDYWKKRHNELYKKVSNKRIKTKIKKTVKTNKK